MDDACFDAFARSLQSVRSRRSTLGLIAAIAARASLPTAAAARSAGGHRCPSGQRRCKASKRDHACVDLQTDPLNCGKCGWRCERGTPCVCCQGGQGCDQAGGTCTG